MSTTVDIWSANNKSYLGMQGQQDVLLRLFRKHEMHAQFLSLTEPERGFLCLGRVIFFLIYIWVGELNDMATCYVQYNNSTQYYYMK